MLITQIQTGIVTGVCALFLVSSVAGGQEKDPGVAGGQTKGFDLVGDYRYVGDDDGGEYAGTAKITAHRDAFKIQYDNGVMGTEGIGIFDGKILSVCWADGRSHGVLVFETQKDGTTLVGRWTELGGDGKIKKETFTRIQAGGNDDGPKDSASTGDDG